MLVDLHAHSSGISKCCRVPAEEVIRVAKEHGIDGIVLTNHYSKHHMRDGEDFPAFAKRYVEEFQYAKRCGEEQDVRVLFGIEVSLEQYEAVHVLVYGVEEAFVERPLFVRPLPTGALRAGQGKRRCDGTGAPLSQGEPSARPRVSGRH